MTIEEYFGDWSQIVNLDMVNSIMKRLLPVKDKICPNLKDVFKAFRFCPLKNLHCIILGQDPYPNVINNQPVATGIAFGNRIDTSDDRLSPSLEVLKESVINFSMPHNHIIFDPSLEKWEEQGVLMLNSALTCVKGKPGSHLLLWRPFITDFLTTLSLCKSNLVYVLMGNQAQSLDWFIDNEHNTIIKWKHPSYYARQHESMPMGIWKEINDSLWGYGYPKMNWLS